MSDNCYLALCAIAKDENPFLREWIAYHHLIGFERIFIYDNESAVPLRDSVPDMLASGMVESFTIQGQQRQLTAYNHCLREYGSQCRWIAFFDLDEFLWLRGGLDARAFVADFENFGGISLNERRCSSSGHLGRPQGLALEHYRQTLFDGIVMKCIVQPQYVELPMSPHHFIYKEDKYAVNCDKWPCAEAYGPLAVDKAVLHHHYWRSQQDFEIKSHRQDAFHSSNPRSDRSFFQQAAAPWTENNDMLIHAARVKELMQSGHLAPYFPLDAINARNESYRAALPRMLEALERDEKSGPPGLAHLLFCLNQSRFRDKAAYLAMGVKACLLAKDTDKAREAALDLLRAEQKLTSYLELLRVELAAGNDAEIQRLGAFLLQASIHMKQADIRQAAHDLAAEYGKELDPGSPLAQM